MSCVHPEIRVSSRILRVHFYALLSELKRAGENDFLFPACIFISSYDMMDA